MRTSKPLGWMGLLCLRTQLFITIPVHLFKTSNFVDADDLSFFENNGTAIYAGELDAKNLFLHQLNRDANATSIITEGFLSFQDSNISECNGTTLSAGGGINLSSVDLLNNNYPAVQSGGDVVLDRVRIWDNNESAVTASGGVTATNSSFSSKRWPLDFLFICQCYLLFV